MTARAVAAACAAVAALACACTSSGGTAPSSPPGSTPATLPNPLPTTALPTTGLSAPTLPSSSPIPTPSSPVSTLPNPLPSTTMGTPHPTPTHSGNGCQSSQLKVSSVPGGASQGMQFGGIVFTNVSAKTCTLRGYPTAQLVHGDQPVGKPARPSGRAATTITLRPHDSAQTLLSGGSTCQSPLSDHVQVVAPGTTTPVAVPMQLRGCSLLIDPVEAA